MIPFGIQKMEMTIKMLPVVTDTKKAIRYFSIINPDEIVDLEKVINAQSNFWDLDRDEEEYLRKKIKDFS